LNLTVCNKIKIKVGIVMAFVRMYLNIIMVHALQESLLITINNSIDIYHPNLRIIELYLNVNSKYK